MLEEGESPEQAACRELIEEAGIRDVELGPAIWTRRDTFTFDGIAYDQRETIFYVRLDSYVEAAPTFTDEQLALEGIAGHRWWTLDELEGVTTAPRELISLVRDLLRDGPPPEPIDAGV